MYCICMQCTLNIKSLGPIALPCDWPFYSPYLLFLSKALHSDGQIAGDNILGLVQTSLVAKRYLSSHYLMASQESFGPQTFTRFHIMYMDAQSNHAHVTTYFDMQCLIPYMLVFLLFMTVGWLLVIGLWKEICMVMDTWSCHILGLAFVLMLRPFSLEVVMSPDFQYRTSIGTSILLITNIIKCMFLIAQLLTIEGSMWPFNRLTKTKRRRSDPVLWQKPLHQQKCQKGKVTTQTTPQKVRLNSKCGPT